MGDVPATSKTLHPPPGKTQRRHPTALQYCARTMQPCEVMEEEADSIKLPKAIQRISYDYQPHEYPPLGAWDAIDK